MELKLICGTWIREDDEKVIDVLQASDKWLSAEELAEITGLPLKSVKHTVKLLKQQERLYESRRKYFESQDL